MFLEGQLRTSPEGYFPPAERGGGGLSVDAPALGDCQLPIPSALSYPLVTPPGAGKSHLGGGCGEKVRWKVDEISLQQTSFLHLH